MPQSTARAAAHPSTANDRSSLYEEITSKIIAELEAGRLPWIQPSHLRRRNPQITCSRSCRMPRGARRQGTTSKAQNRAIGQGPSVGAPPGAVGPEEEGGGGSRDGLADFGREAPGRPVAENRRPSHGQSATQDRLERIA